MADVTTSFDRLVAAAGLSAEWRDADGVDHRVTRDALHAILGALGLPGQTAAQIDESLARLADAASRETFASADIGERIAIACPVRPGPATIVMEDGTRVATIVESVGGAASIGGIDQVGYHLLEHAGGTVDLAVAPRRCFPPPSGRGWGAAVQIPALRGARPAAYGDFAALAETAQAFARRGAALLAINPVHALFPADATRFSPYSPSTRLYLNGLMAAPCEREAGDPAELIDWHTALPNRRAALRRDYDRLDDAHRTELRAFAARRGARLAEHARFDALHAHFLAASGATGWRDWPAAFHDPASADVQHLAASLAGEIDFHVFLQWRADADLGAAQAAALAGGMAIGLVADLAVGMDAGGSHGWSRPGDLLGGLSIGAPPDPLGPSGQNWGITALAPAALRRTGFSAFRDTLSAALRHAGGLRIDHALGLARLWVIPEGGSAGEGAYLAMPLEHLLRIVAIESWRHRAIIIGEDLGTVPPGFRDTIHARGMLGMEVLPFEREADRFKPASRWSPAAVAMTGTHDTPTVAGWWLGRDLAWRAQIDGTAIVPRDDDRAALWTAIGQGPVPTDPAPVVDAAIAFVAETPCPLVVVPFEDLLGTEEQPNLPGTTTEHPNWRRRAADPTATLLDRPAVARRIAILNKATSS